MGIRKALRVARSTLLNANLAGPYHSAHFSEPCTRNWSNCAVSCRSMQLAIAARMLYQHLNDVELRRDTYVQPLMKVSTRCWDQAQQLDNMRESNTTRAHAHAHALRDKPWQVLI